ncbi:MAG: M23 family metallopeptidase [Alphaproteobacteria bacterium]|nr:M23 family metallopeptidase [Alphaproteobacteria bacterium]
MRRLAIPAWIALAALALTACAGSGGRAVVVDRSYEGRDRSSAAPGEYVVQAGDTVYGIAQRNGISTRALIDWNSLRPPYTLIVGDRLKLPASEGYVVQRGDSLYAISRKVGVDMASLARANNLRAPYTIRVGQKLQLPRSAAPAAVQRSVQTASLPPATRPDASSAAASPTVKPAPPRAPVVTRPVRTVPAPPPRAGSGFIWPVEGRVLSTFGAKNNGLHNDGVNIAAPRGAPVRAADNGVVAYAGKEIRGFGNLLLIKHEGGLITAYAHNDAVLVARGDKVTRGQVVAKVGTSGGVETPQLHFEVRQGTRAVDPKKYLPG